MLCSAEDRPHEAAKGEVPGAVCYVSGAGLAGSKYQRIPVLPQTKKHAQRK